MDFYRQLVRPLLFRTEAEWMHDWTIRAAELVGSSRFACATTAAWHRKIDPRLATEVADIHFHSPLGLAAGFDKNARAVLMLAALGFGYIEIGSVSAEPSSGNPRPRLFRLPSDQGIVVNYGLPNDGADRIAERLKTLRRTVPLGINIVSTNRGPDTAQETDSAVIADYVRSVARLQDYGDYLCLNMSCPNTRDGRGFFHDARRVRELLTSLDTVGVKKPLFLKVAPFSELNDLDEFLTAVAPARFVSGFSVNLPPGKPADLSASARELAQMPGAVSGKPSEAATDRTIRDLYRRMDKNRYRIIGSGGIFSAEDAYRKIRLGASLVQLLTALVYEGPGIAKRINHGLAHLLKRDGFDHVSEAVGVDALKA